MEKQGQWKKGIKLPDPVNVGMYDCAPHIMPDGKTLFFSSARPGGKGGLDIWSVRRKGPGHPWEKAMNESDINTEKNEANVSLDITGEHIYVAVASAANPKFDIYEKRVDWKFAEPTFTLQGRITNVRDGKPVSAEIICESFGKKYEKLSVKTDPRTGHYSITIEKGKSYSLTVEAQGYLFLAQKLDLTSLERSAILPLQIGLLPLKKGEILVVQTIYFDPDSATIRPESRMALDRISEILRRNQKIKIRITGHVADVNASRAESILLSKQRAESVKQYLVSKRCAASRMETQGLGATKPIGDNRTEKGREMNRRTEFEIIATE